MAGRNPSAAFIRSAGIPLLAAAILASAALPAQAGKLSRMPPASDAVAVYPGGAKPIQAREEFCNRNPADCAIDLAEPEAIELTPKVWKTIVRINKQVNSTIIPVTDQDYVGVIDRWEFPKEGMGDCEDIQLLKRRKLEEAGFPRRAMRMTVVLDEVGAGHAVLMIRTNRGDYILDNKAKAVLPWRKTGYTYIKRESAENLGWVSLGTVVAAPVSATAGR